MLPHGLLMRAKAPNKQRRLLRLIVFASLCQRLPSTHPLTLTLTMRTFFFLVKSSSHICGRRLQHCFHYSTLIGIWEDSQQNNSHMKATRNRMLWRCKWQQYGSIRDWYERCVGFISGPPSINLDRIEMNTIPRISLKAWPIKKNEG